jgi:hypothetical protein
MYGITLPGFLDKYKKKMKKNEEVPGNLIQLMVCFLT